MKLKSTMNWKGRAESSPNVSICIPMKKANISFAVGLLEYNWLSTIRFAKLRKSLSPTKVCVCRDSRE